jgi:hypothetical protein
MASFISIGPLGFFDNVLAVDDTVPSWKFK